MTKSLKDRLIDLKYLEVNPVDADTLQEAIDLLGRPQPDYGYMGRNGKPTLARDLEDRAELAEAKLEKALARISSLEALVGLYESD